MSLTFELLIQILYYCTPSIDSTDRQTSMQNEHPCDNRFCDFIWSESIDNTLVIINASADDLSSCMMSKMGEKWKNGHQSEFTNKVTNKVKPIASQPHVECIQYL